MAEIVLKNLSKRFGKETVIPNLNLSIKDGSFTVLVGPSGCGKSTTLRMIAGLEKQTDGELWIGGKLMNDVSPGRRDVAMVFQNYALYPTMTVKENIEFGLINRKVPKKERETLISEITEIVGLAPYLNRKPSTLSGGQRQRVALARAMVKKPKVFLMDEPLSNLDAQLRNQMRMELIQLHKRLQTTFVFVTHDQVEAMSLGDEIVIMNKGEIQQADNPMEIYKQPRNVFSAAFIGTPPMNILPTSQMESLPIPILDNVKHIGFRPEKMKINERITGDTFDLRGHIIARETLGSETIYQIQSAIGVFLAKSYTDPIDEGMNVTLSILQHDLFFFGTDGYRIDFEFNELETKELIKIGGAS
jgi:sn-glycerol 3-phosphate transport system ATP-binding protein